MIQSESDPILILRTIPIRKNPKAMSEGIKTRVIIQMTVLYVSTPNSLDSPQCVYCLESRV